MSEELIRIGTLMANTLFNLKQRDEFPERLKRSFGEMQKAWDAALRTPAPSPWTWQPIEKAPRDGTRVLVFWEGKVRLGWVADSMKSRDGGDWWRTTPMVHVKPKYDRPSWWMPLPPAPAKEDGHE